MFDLGAGFTEYRSLESIEDLGELENRCQNQFSANAPFQLKAVRLGNEFCERLMPSSKQVKKAIQKAERLGLSFALVLSNLTDKGHRKLERLLPVLPEGGAVVVNDWGTAAMISAEHPHLTLSAGRLMCKHLKEARISAPKQDPEVTWPLSSPPFVDLLHDLGIEKAEVDLAPHTKPPTRMPVGISLSLHLNRGYSAKSHLCKVGSLHQPEEKKFTPEHLCRRECRTYQSTVVEQAYPETDALVVHQRGNTWFFDYSEQMQATIAGVIESDCHFTGIVELD